MALVRTVASTLILVIFVYVAHQLTRFTDLSWIGKSLIVAFLILLFSMVIGTFLYFWKDKSPEPNAARDRLMNVSLTAMAYINFLITFVILRDIFAFADNLLSTAPTAALYSSQATAALLGLPVLFLALGNLIIRTGPRTKKVELAFKNIHPDLHGLRIAHITDLHISPSLSPNFVKRLVEQVQRMKPDLVVFTGDILDSFASKHKEEFRTLHALKAPLGVCFVPGNHEYYWDIHEGLQAFRNLGFHVLLNDTLNIRKGEAVLQVSGVPDPAAKHFDQDTPNFATLKAQQTPESFKVLLSHQPSLAEKTHTLGYDLQLSGHTHGGQFFPWNWLIVFFEKYSKGLYRLGNMQLYVNQGTGYWGPQLRLGTYCELAEIVLRKD